ncbi:probable arginine--tRNA ligase, mitochondrial isoform X1 [Mercenaria mercenaria]|uniref:probable arginine--tRNA ligase, mitochondrial isoform X1 n=1 Tax=Mercenaria mercenaria TaxID=6596 RepID=UPI00234E8072|nr:probable arginine--tRNA ligase, mitochondrial isoform X1 [Mercenaria mercenaria]
MRLTYCLLRSISKRNLLKSVRVQGINFGFGDENQRLTNSRKCVIVEYSSPNIAKPFHVGHLRSTILGNFIANLYERLGWKVVRLNYLGDWGTQFGLLAVGFQRYGNEEELQADPLHHLFQIYVKINADVVDEKKEGKTMTHQAGMDAFRKMEQGDQELLKIWQRFKDISIAEYSKLYKKKKEEEAHHSSDIEGYSSQGMWSHPGSSVDCTCQVATHPSPVSHRLGVTFTEYHSESMYNKDAMSVTDRLKETGMLQTDSEGKGYIQIETEKGIPDRVNVLKSDGTTLYITRDIAAILDRQKTFNFDKIHYVVENAQHMHFCHLCGVMNRFPGWKNRLNEDIHIKFGRIEGISTRKGNVVFLKDVLDEATTRIKASILSKKSTKIEGVDIDAVAEELGKSAIIIQDLGQRRIKNYKFSWDRIMYSTKLQYCHARLCSIERNSGLNLEEDFHDDALTTNNQAGELISHLIKFEDIIQESFDTLEPYFIVRYLDQLCDHVNSAYRTCHVKNTDPSVGQAYLQMFHASKIILSNGMILLGLHPLERM